MLLLLLLTLVIRSTLAGPSVRASPCIPKASGDLEIDDVPAIRAALDECGAAAPVLIPERSWYNIRSELDFSSYRGSRFQLEGTLNVTNGNWSYWSTRKGILSFSSTDSIQLYSIGGNGFVNGNGAGSATFKYGQKIVPLFHVSGSKSLSFRNFRSLNAPGTYFEIDDFSESIELATLTTTFTGKSGPLIFQDGFAITNSSDITIRNSTVLGTSRCVAVQNGVNGLDAKDLTCNNLLRGVTINLESQTVDFAQTANNISFRNINIGQTTTATGIRTGNVGTFTGKHITWDGIHLAGVGDWSEIVSCIGGPKDCARMGVTLTLDDVNFRNFAGQAFYNTSMPACVDVGDRKHDCHITTENIQLTKPPT